MQEFWDYILEGIKHITDLRGIDHMAFLLVLCAPYDLRNLRKVILLVTAFTLGHMLTLFLGGMDVIHADVRIVEFLIPVTIALTAFSNIWRARRKAYGEDRLWFLVIVVIAFGCIHGLGFSSYFRMMNDSTPHILYDLIAFGLGVEVGQLIIVTVFLFLGMFLGNLFRIGERMWNVGVSMFIAGASAMMIVENYPF